MEKQNRSEIELLKSVTVDTAISSIKESQLHISDEYIRKLFDNTSKRRKFKTSEFADGDVYDSLTGAKLTKTKAEAKDIYGDDWKQHIAETDHIVPVKTVYDKHHSNPFLSDEDIKEIANIEENYNLKSGTTNASKQDSSNIEMLEQQKRNNVVIDKETERALRREQRRAETAIQSEVNARTIKNVANEAGTGAKEALDASVIPIAMDIIFNVVQVCDNKKDIKSAMVDISKNVATVAFAGSATKLLNTALKNVDNPVLKFALEHNLPAQIIAISLMIKDDVKGIKDHSLSKEEATSNILSKFAGLVGGKIGQAVGSKGIALLQQHSASKVLGWLATHGGPAMIKVAAAAYVAMVAKNLFDEVVGKGSWVAIKQSNVDCRTLANVMKESVNGIKTNVAIFTYAMENSGLIQEEIDLNFEEFERRKNK